MNTNPKKFLVLLSIKTQNLPNKLAKFTVTLNGVEQSRSTDTNNVVEFSMYSNFGNNILTVDFLNKDANDTVVDQSGKITHDLNIELINLQVGGIDITSQIKKSIPCITHDNQSENTYGFMYKNSQLRLEFCCPIFYFLRNISLVENTNMA